MLSPAELLGRRGPLARCLPGFAPRPEQQEMAEAVARALREQGVLVTEAGTGTGKTFAYLVPALTCGAKVVVSTGTKTLQEQLYHRDIPLVRRALAASGKAAMLKGRANYLCRYRLERAEDGLGLARGAAAGLAAVRAWAGRTRSGDLAELAALPDDSPLWSEVTSTADNCLGAECPAYSECHVTRARRAAQEADIVVINHHLLCSDIVLRQEGFGELLPEAHGLIVDEAHQLPEIAAGFFGQSVGGRQLAELARDVARECRGEAADMPGLGAAAARLEREVAALRQVLGPGARRAAWGETAQRPEVAARIAELRAALGALHGALAQAAERGKGLESCARRAGALAQRLAAFAAAQSAEDHVAWVETSRRSFVLRDTPLDLSAQFRECLERYRCAWVFTSATLAVGASFAHFTSRLGIESAAAARWGSPFDYAHNALLYLPAELPEPGSGGYTAAVVAAILPALRASGGRAFVLFTSHRALQEAASLLRSAAIDFPLLVQGEAARGALLERFRELGNAVLLATGSFWEGVDVRGPALSCVIIDKLPFAAPDDPVLQARAALIERRGGNPFMDHQLPQAVIALKQGVGRLIRDAADRGVMVLCDPRLFSRSYGRIFLDNLPPMPRSRSLADVERFFAAEGARAAAPS